MRGAALLQLDLGVGNDLLPSVVFGPEEFSAFFRAATGRIGADLGKRGYQLRILECGVDRAVELGEHVGRQSSGREDAEPDIDVESCHAAFSDGWNIGING